MAQNDVSWVEILEGIRLEKELQAKKQKQDEEEVSELKKLKKEEEEVQVPEE